MSRRYRPLPHMSKALVHRHVLLRNLLCRMFASVVLVGHWIYKRGKQAAIEFVRVEKYKGTGAVVNVDVFEARALG